MTKLQLITSTKNNDDKLIRNCTLNIILKEFICELKIYDLQITFLLTQPDPFALDGSVLPDTIPLSD